MKNIISIVKKSLGLGLLSLAFVSCQDMDRPELGDYAKDSNTPGGPLKFYTAFNGETSNPLMNAVDSIRAKFPSINTLSSITGVNGKAVQGEAGKHIKYSSANDFAKTAGSFTIAFWEKKGDFRTEHIFSMPAVKGYHWSGASMFLLMEGSAATPIAKLFVKDSKGENWFTWANGAVTEIYDGEWHHLAFVYDSTTSVMTLYKDGVAGNTATWANHGAISLEPAKITSLIIGAGPALKEGDWLGNSWTGGIDQFRMYGTVLTATEIQSLYTSKD
jgi:hypothetical protein